MRKRQSHLLLGASTLIAASCSTSAFAQTDGASNSGQLSDIIVTAQKRAENLQDVPIAVTAVSSETLDSAVALGTRDLPSLVPGLLFNQSLGSVQIFVRGVGQTIGQLGTEPPTSIYVDGIYLPQSHSAVFSFSNIEQVTLLKGPQGTLFGRNTTGGVLQITTKEPSFTPAFKADVGLASYGTVSAHAYASGGLSGTVAVSVAAYGTDQDGYGENINVNNPSDDFLKSKEWGVQGKILWRPSDSTDVTVNVMHAYQWNSSAMATGVYPGSLASDGSEYLGFYTFNLDVDPFSRTEQTMGSFKVEHDLGWAQLTNTAAYHYLHEDTVFVTTGIPFGGASIWSIQDNSSSSFTEELSLQSPAEQDFQWTVGLFYFNDRTRTDFASFLNAGQRARLLTVQKTNSYAAYAQATYSITPEFRLTGGFRYTIDKKNVSGEILNSAGNVTGTYEAVAAALNYPTRLKSEEPTYRVALDYDVAPDILSYASFTRGYKGGSFSLASASNPPVNAEYVDSYEIGLKTQLFDRRLRLNIAAFYADYTDMQVRAFLQTATLQNAASSQIKGVDVDFEAAVSSNFSIAGGFEVMDTKFNKFENFDCRIPLPAGGNATAVCDVTGNGLPRAPKFTGNITPAYTAELADGSSIRLSSNIYHNSGFAWEPDGRVRQPSYTTINASIRYTLPGDHFSLEIWGRNLTKERVFGTGTIGPVDAYTPGQPRMVGVTLAYKN